MRVAALYDIHGNLPALEAVLADVESEGVERIVAGGDVLWGRSSRSASTRSAGAMPSSSRGTASATSSTGVNESAAWCRDRLSADELDFVAGWPATVELELDGLGGVLFCHATPRSDNENLTATTPDADVAAALAGVEADVVVGGHTHVQDDRRFPAGRGSSTPAASGCRSRASTGRSGRSSGRTSS